MDKDTLRATFGITEARLSDAQMTWDDLEEIERRYAAIRGGLESVGRYVVDSLLRCPTVHSIKYRLKDSDHLLEKVVRKRAERPDRKICADNYRDEITDLVGIRALHLFKEDWLSVHTYIKEMWELSEQPIAYVRSGDPEKITEFYRQNGCEVREHRFGYRSVHYLISSSPDRERYLVEIQARTVFEEAWGEIDHVISYPYAQDNELLVRLSSILNRLSANADELGSYMRYLKNRTDHMQNEYAAAIGTKNRLIADLQSKIDQLEIGAAQKASITSDLVALGQNRTNEARFDEHYPWLEHLMESDLFRGITERVEKVMQAEGFQPIELSDQDIEMLTNAQRELVKMLDSSDDVRKVLEHAPIHQRLRMLEDATRQRGSAADHDE